MWLGGYKKRGVKRIFSSMSTTENTWKQSASFLCGKITFSMADGNYLMADNDVGAIKGKYICQLFQQCAPCGLNAKDLEDVDEAVDVDCVVSMPGTAITAAKAEPPKRSRPSQQEKTCTLCPLIVACNTAPKRTCATRLTLVAALLFLSTAIAGPSGALPGLRRL